MDHSESPTRTDRIDADTPPEGLRPRQYLMPLAIGIPALIVMVVVASIEDLPLRDPDARFVGSPLALISIFCLGFLLLDVIARAIRRVRSSDVGFGGAAREVFLGRWWGRRGLIVIASILGFYAAYLSYRNLKSFLPFVTDGALHDQALLDIEDAIFFGNQPAELLHDLLGTGISAEVLSTVYLVFLTFVPVSIGAALVWSSRLSAGIWYVTSLGIVWMLGVGTYYLVPSLGPIYAAPELFADLPQTGVSELSVTLLDHRSEVLADPFATDAVQGIAGFASLHIAVLLTAALIAHLVRAPRPLRICLWIFVALTSLSTVYHGWHYVVDDIAGAAIAFVGVFGAAALLGLRRPYASRDAAESVPRPAPEPQPELP